MTEETASALKPAKRGRPRNKTSSFTQEQIDKLVGQKLDEKLADFASKIALARGQSGETGMDGLSDGDQRLVRSLTHALTEVSDTENRRVRVAPDEMAARAEAAESMANAIIDVVTKIEQEDGPHPKYRVTRQVYIDDVLINPTYRHPHSRAIVPTEIEFIGPPDESLVPLNTEAKAIYGFYMRSIGNKPTPQAVVAYKRASEKFGLHTVNGDAASQRIAPAVTGNGRHQGTVRVLRGGMPEAETVRVLGTIAPPARQVG